MTNPLFPGLNKKIDFQKVDAEAVKEASDRIILETRQLLEKIYHYPDSQRTFGNTILKIDDLTNELEKVSSIIHLTGFVHPDEKIRNAALEQMSVLSKFSNEIALDENLFKAVKAFAQAFESKSLTGYRKRFFKKTLDEFRRNGFELSREKRQELKIIKDKLSELDIAFSSNISTYKDELVVNEEDMNGLPDDYKNVRRTDDGKYRIDLSYPSYRPFMKFSNSDKARKELYCKFNNRAADKNLGILKEMLIFRKKQAELLGYTTYAFFSIEDKMAKTPDAVWKFNKELIEKIQDKFKKDMDELLEIKRSYLHETEIRTIDAWESAFYSYLLMKEKYEVDEEKVKEYFELNNVINGIFQINSILFDISFNEIENPSVWHPEVKMYRVNQKNKTIGYFYLDMFPRDDKYQHAAMFPIIPGKQHGNNYQKPVAALICNFPKPTDERPSLLPHNEVETLFHEFGHLMHDLLTTSDLASQAGTSVARDFVETPSQLFENWTWDYNSLKIFAKHYNTGELLPKELFNKMLAAKKTGSGIAALQQLFYGALDMTFHDKYDPEGNQSTTEIVKLLQNQIAPYSYVEDTHFEASFGHLSGYAAGYYGYLWAEVYSEDIFSVFKENGVLNPEIGEKYLDQILSKGSTKDEFEIIKAFLGRDPNPDAFLKSLGV